MGGAVSAGTNNDDLVDKLKAADYVRSEMVERVFRAVDRGDYFTSDAVEQAYRDMAWKSDRLHLSAPCIYAQVMEGLQLSPGQSFLNLGSGTGYLSTMAGLILGPYGVNHGIELHADVVSYAQKRLEEFHNKSLALDAFSFCEPQFLQGNCMCLPPDMPQYDRVYCGASCPETHENYMKSLIKVGGVLVMPLNDQLLKITRRSENTWDTEALLPVSFSSLVMPGPSCPPTNIILPSASDLQNLCRHEIRSILRSIIDEEHPGLAKAANRPVTVQKSQRENQRPLSRMIIPYVPYYESDDERGTGSGEDRDESEPKDPLPEAQHISAVIELVRSLSGRRRREREREQEEENSDLDSDQDLEDTAQTFTEFAHRLVEDGEKLVSSFEDTVGDQGNHSSGRGEGSTKSQGRGDTVSRPEQEQQPNSSSKLQENGRITSGNSKSDSQAACPGFVTDATLPVPDMNELPTPDKEDKEDEEEEEEEKDTVVVAKTSSSSSKENSVEPAPTLSKSDPIAMTCPLFTHKAGKKREKFDSGVGDELENGKGPSSASEQEDNSMDIDSDSDYSDHSIPKSEFSHWLDPDDPTVDLNDPNDPDYMCGGNFRNCKPESGNKVESPSTFSPPAESYSTYMREKIKGLPLPMALKAYLNYNREL
ncbi:uncharacterized protein LOC143039616 [Oratosquilla oratoria]|uniref:uncharacterized protein LOC143039616 n=1 Tax=Oratosquilla oratoria TaxID=337810 RepID=UPI003F75AEA1